MKKKYVLIVSFFILFIFGVKALFNLKKENAALRVKVLTLKKDKKMPVPWSRLTKDSIKRLSPIHEKQVIKKDEIAVIEDPISTENLAKIISKNMLNLKTLNVKSLEETIKIAEEIINREPDSYSAYKAKLISLLILESKFDQQIDDYEINKTIDSLTSFEMNTDALNKREAALIGKGNNQLKNLANQLNDISLLRDEITLQSSALDKSSPEYFELQNQESELAVRENMTNLDIENAENKLLEEIAQTKLPNEDLVDIPFYRLMAKGDFTRVIENAESYLEQFPNASNAFYFLIRALDAEGREAEALKAIEETKLSPDALMSLQLRLEATSGEDPKKYWENLKF